jgi:hypothetical protein
VTWFNALQLVVASAALAIIARRMRTLCFEAALDIDPFVEALDAALALGQLDLARRRAAACLPAWPALLAMRALEEQAEHRDRAQSALDESLLELEQAAWRGLSAIVALGRIASPLAFIGIILEIGAAFRGDAGLVALQRGLALSLGLQRALLCFALGVSTFGVCFAGMAILQRRARALCSDLRRVAALLAKSQAQ